MAADFEQALTEASSPDSKTRFLTAVVRDLRKEVADLRAALGLAGEAKALPSNAGEVVLARLEALERVVPTLIAQQALLGGLKPLELGAVVPIINGAGAVVTAKVRVLVADEDAGGVVVEREPPPIRREGSA